MHHTRLRVKAFPLSVNYVNAFLCYDEAAREAFLVDCGAWEPAIPAFLKDRDLHLRFLLLTHAHYDHVDGVDALQRDARVPVYSAAKRFGKVVSEGDRIPFAGVEIAVLATPGHTSDGLAFYVPPFVFVGDAIFAGAVGGTADRAHFEEETGHVWAKILSLPDDTLILPGHGAPSTVGVERLYNPFFHRCW